MTMSDHARDRTSRSVHPADWTKAMKVFSDRNAGRRTWLEIDDPLMGAQEQEHGFQLLGVTHDHRDQRIQIMLGSFGDGGPHLTHTIGDIVQVDILTDEAGRDTMLRIAQPETQTLLRVEQPPLSESAEGRTP
jgi:hypothetical protein